jgi:hypothetical protein
VLNVCTFRLVSLASTSTGVPIAPKAVATLLAIRLTVAEKIGLNPKLIRMAAGRLQLGDGTDGEDGRNAGGGAGKA